MTLKDNNTKFKPTTFSKDNPIVEISSKQNQIHVQNLNVPTRPKETPKSK